MVKLKMTLTLFLAGLFLIACNDDNDRAEWTHAFTYSSSADSSSALMVVTKTHNC